MTKNASKRRLVFTFGLLAASVGSVANAAEPKAGDVIENSIRMKLAYIPPGEFAMGSPETEKERRYDEKSHQVTFTKGFYLGVYEVTQSQFEKVLGRNPAWFSKKGGGSAIVSGQDTAAFPVERVTWYDAVDFCNALSTSEKLPEYYTLRKVKREKDDSITSAEVAENGGNGYRLPTEAEWEYACRAGTKTPFHFGDVLNGNDANVNGEFPYGTETKGPYLGRPRKVGGYAPNKFGLYDMHGNVWEWCNDRYGNYAGDNYARDGVDPQGPGCGEYRVLRGGSFVDFALDARSAYRNMCRSEIAWGFRAARTFALEPKAIAPKAVAPVESKAANPKAGDVIENSIKMKLAYIPPGEFDMGSPESENVRFDWEKLHHVKLTKGFYLGSHEVTQAQFEKVLARNPSWFSKDGRLRSAVTGQDTSSFPVENVSWYDAVEFCNALSKSEGFPEYYTLARVKHENGSTSAAVTENGGKGYRLPTEAEWEYACRAGTTTPFHFGEMANGKEANVRGNKWPYGTSIIGPCLGRTCTVGSYPANAFGLYDMHGNVAEWCKDRYGNYAGDGVDPQGPDKEDKSQIGKAEVRVLRGGSFDDVAHFVRSAYRDHNVPWARFVDPARVHTLHFNDFYDIFRPSPRFHFNGFRAARTYTAAP